MFIKLLIVSFVVESCSSASECSVDVSFPNNDFLEHRFVDSLNFLWRRLFCCLGDGVRPVGERSE